jgi:hypothetical protein
MIKTNLFPFSYETINKNSKIILNKTMRQFQIESLELMGFFKKDIYQHINICTRFQNLYISNMRNAHSQDSERDPNGRLWVSNQLKKTLLLLK